MNSTMISYVNSYAGIQPWFVLHSTEFTHEFMIMKSYMISLSWIHQHEFRDEFIHMNSDMIPRYSSWSLAWIHWHIWIHIMNSYMISWSWIHMQHFMTYQFTYEFLCMKNILKSYLKSCVPRFQMSHGASQHPALPGGSGRSTDHCPALTSWWNLHITASCKTSAAAVTVPWLRRTTVTGGVTENLKAAETGIGRAFYVNVRWPPGPAPGRKLWRYASRLSLKLELEARRQRLSRSLAAPSRCCQSVARQGLQFVTWTKPPRRAGPPDLAGCGRGGRVRVSAATVSAATPRLRLRSRSCQIWQI